MVLRRAVRWEPILLICAAILYVGMGPAVISLDNILDWWGQ